MIDWSDLVDEKWTDARLLARTDPACSKKGGQRKQKREVSQDFVQWRVNTVVSGEAMLRINSMRRSFGRKRIQASKSVIAVIQPDDLATLLAIIAHLYEDSGVCLQGSWRSLARCHILKASSSCMSLIRWDELAICR